MNNTVCMKEVHPIQYLLHQVLSSITNIYSISLIYILVSYTYIMKHKQGIDYLRLNTENKWYSQISPN